MLKKSILICAALSVAACDRANVEGTAGAASDPRAVHAAAMLPQDEGCPHQQGACQHEEEAAVPEERAEIAVGYSPSLGEENAPLTLIVFSDFQCPFCSKGADRLKVLQAKFGDKLRIAFKQRPLPFHYEARGAAKAALAAAKQGKFWEYHDALFENQRALDQAGLERQAKELGLDLDRFRADLASDEIDQQIKRDEAEADKLGVRGTPTFFLNGRMITGAQPIEVFEKAIAEELAK